LKVSVRTVASRIRDRDYDQYQDPAGGLSQDDGVHHHVHEDEKLEEAEDDSGAFRLNLEEREVGGGVKRGRGRRDIFRHGR